MRDHLRGWLLVSAYCILPGYIVTRFTYYGFLFPHFCTTTTSLVASLVYGGFFYVTYLIFRYISSIGFEDRTQLRHFLIRIGCWLVLLFQIFILPLPLAWSPVSLLWNKALILDLRRTRPDMAASAEANAKKTLSPKLYVSVFGPPPASRTFAPTPVARRYEPMDEIEQPPSMSVTAREVRPNATPVAAPFPSNPKILSGVGKNGAVIDGKFYLWGRQSDGSVLAPTTEPTRVTVTQTDGSIISLTLRAE